MRLLEIMGVVSAAAVVSAVYVWTHRRYEHILATALPSHLLTAARHYIDMDDPPFLEKLQCVLLRFTTRWTRVIHEKPYLLRAEPHRYLTGLKRTRAATAAEASAPSSSIDGSPNENKQKNTPKPPLVIGTIRMGFGHHRIAYAVASYALADPRIRDGRNDNQNDDADADAVADADAGNATPQRDVYFHDIATIGDDESSLVDDAETAYSLGSRALTELPHGLERFLAKSSASGGPSALRMQLHIAPLLMALMDGLDHESPVIATHPLVAAIAVACGFAKVVNLVVDNHPQWFVVVPGALNLVQGPSLYRELLKKGVPDAELQLVGHWNPRHIVESIPQATQRRIERVQNRQPLRLLIPSGGAGAQQSFLTDLVERCLPLVRQGRLQLFLNAGDHDHFKRTFQQHLQAADVEYESIFDVAARDRFVDRMRQGQEPKYDVTLFAFNTSYAAVTTTDELVPYVDVLVCKPSEMAFYAVPKLMIRRVGDHEAKSAVRAAEVGEGTLEAATVDEVMADIRQFLNKPGDLITMNQMIRKNNEYGMYDGAKIAVERALAMA